VHTAAVRRVQPSGPSQREASGARARAQVDGPRWQRPDEVTYREAMRLLREHGRLAEALHVCADLRRAGAPLSLPARAALAPPLRLSV
jgi:hypothetical protein